MKNILNSIIIFFQISYLTCQITILGPPSLVEKMKNFQSSTKSGRKIKLNNSIDFDSVLGNFGEIPYGKTLTGKVYYTLNKDGTNNWCDPDQIVAPADLDKPSNSEYSPIYLVDL